MLGLMHYNPGLPHQRDHAKAFAQCGFKCVPTPEGEADVHVVSGPWFALERWRRHPRVLVLDRAWWGDPISVSLGWLQPDGSRRFAPSDGTRPHPVPAPWKRREQSALVLADYQQNVARIVRQAARRFKHVRIRRHPSEERNISLAAHLALSDVAIGTLSSALFEALISGVPAICLNESHSCAPVCAQAIDAPLYRGSLVPWLKEMAFKQFSLNEIANGTAWQLLKGLI